MLGGEGPRRIDFPEALAAERTGTMRKTFTILALGLSLAVGVSGMPASGQAQGTRIEAAGPTMLELSVKRQLIRRGYYNVDTSRLSRHQVAMLFLTMNQGSSFGPAASAQIALILRGCSATIGRLLPPHC
jgi:hypothetical protein